MIDLSERIREYAIRNRLRYGKAEEKAVIGKVISEFPGVKSDIGNFVEVVKRIVAEVNKADLLGLERYEVKKVKEDRISELRLQDRKENVVMRFAPNPNGPATLGSSRGIVVNSELAMKYNGKFILRFDDTDPKTKRPLLDAYGWYLEDCEWLNAKPDEVYYASDRISLYYGFADDLIRLGKAYVCFCRKDEFKGLKDNKKECPHRDSKVEENLEFWGDMLKGRYTEGDAVLRIKTDIRHRDPALRDWVAFRIIEDPHPRVGNRFRVWPMLDFESAIEDHLLGITNIIRGKDLMDSEGRQRFIYEYLNWHYPETLHWGRLRLEEFGKFSTSRLRKEIEAGRYSGWDDPRVPTLRALRRRGIHPETIRRIMISLGIGENDVSLSLDNIFAENRKIVDPVANRYFFVQDPVEIVIKGAPEIKTRILLHPNFPERGSREFYLKPDDKGNMRLSIPGEDHRELRKGEIIRLMNLFNVKIEEIKKGRITAEYLEEKILDVKKIHWVQDYIKGEIVKPEGIFKGLCEPRCMDLKEGDVIQFERFGFVRLDSVDREKKKLIFYFGHR